MNQFWEKGVESKRAAVVSTVGFDDNKHKLLKDNKLRRLVAFWQYPYALWRSWNPGQRGPAGIRFSSIEAVARPAEFD